jgi:hypothetical protein
LSELKLKAHRKLNLTASESSSWLPEKRGTQSANVAREAGVVENIEG